MDALAPRCRTVDGLQSVALAANPWPKSRPCGAKAEGLRFEKALAKRMPGAVHGQWFEFHDYNGRGYCSPDFILDYREFMVVVECKLTDCQEGRWQIDGLYRPILQMHYRRPVRGVLVCKNLRRDSENIESELAMAVKRAEKCIPTLHWRGRGPI